MLLLKHMFYNKIRGRHRRYFMCPLERVLLPLSLQLGVLHLWMVIPAMELRSTISHSQLEEKLLLLVLPWQMCPKVAHVFDFCCVCEACRGDPKKVRRTHNFAPHCVCARGEGNTFNSAHTLIHQSPAKSTSLIKLRWDFLLQQFLEYAHQPVGGPSQKGRRVPCLLGMSLNNRKLNLMSNVSFRQEETAIF